MSKKKGIDLDMQKIIAWCKNNIVLVVLILVSIGAVVGLPRMASSWSDSVESALRDRSGSFTKLDNISGTKVTKPGTNESERVVVNQSLVDAYLQVTDSMRGDAEEVVNRATRMNQKDYEVFFASTLFPKPTQDQIETLPQLFYRQLETEYKMLLEVVNAGEPPTQEELASQLENARVRYMETNLSTRHDADLTQDQRTNLEVHLAKLRMSAVRARAESIGLYMSESSLQIPAFDVTTMPSVGELFLWQWRYWVIADMVGAVGNINGNQTEVTTPIKRLVMLEVLGLPEAGEEPSRGGGKPGGPAPGLPTGGAPSPFGGGGGAPNPFGGPRDPGSGGNPSPGPSPSGGGRKPPKASEQGQLALSHTNRKSGDLYDLLQVRISMVVDTARIPSVLDGLASYNFLTVIDLDLRPVDKFVALGEGYDYGPASVSEMTVVLESAWLRSWTTAYMPDSIKKSLGLSTN